MAKVVGIKPTINQGEVSNTIDLEQVFGAKISDTDTRRLIAESLIEKIVKRTESGKDVNGKGFAKYSKEYVDSLEFKAYDKSAGKINMKLTGSMLASVDVLDDSSTKIKIGIDNEDAPKAFNHQTGDTVKKREFFGVTQKDIDEVKKEFTSDIQSVSDAKKFSVADMFNQSTFSRVFQELKKRGSLF
jgi:hypothetical protein